MIYIRTDGNSQIGTGHVMRCLSIATALSDVGSDCIFITADDNMKPLLDNHGFMVICLDSKWNDLNREIDKMERLITEKGIDKLLVDSYFVTPEYLARLHELTYLIYMDDLNAFTYPCSELINYNIYADKYDYPSRYPDTRLLIGTKYAPLRAEFQNLPPRHVREQAEAVLITTGGSDPFNIAYKIVRLAKKHLRLSRMHYHVIVGAFYPHLPGLADLSKEHDCITIYQGISHISKLMLECDVAVSAGGSTLYELCACGTPTVVFAMADNQVPTISAFSDGFMLGCGDWRDDEETCLNRLISEISRLADDAALRDALSKKCRELIDGLGAKRMVDGRIA